MAATKKTTGKKPVQKTTSNTKKKAQAKQKQVKMPEIKGIILLFVGIFLLFCAYWGSGGKIGDFITKILVILLGTQGRTLLAVALIIHGVMLFARAPSFVNARGSLFLYVLTLNVITIFGLMFNILKNNESLFSSATYQYIINSKAVGGVVGQCLARLYINLFSVVGAWLLILCVSIVLFLVVFRKSLSDKIKTKMDERKEQKEIRKENERNERGRQLMFTSFEDEKDSAPLKAKTSSFGLSSFEDDAAVPEAVKDKKTARLDSFDSGKPPFKETPKEQEKSASDFDEDDAPQPEKPKTALPKKNEYIFPPIKLLDVTKSKSTGAERQEVVANAASLEKTLADFGVDAKVSEICMGPTVTRYELQLQPGIRVSKVVSLSDDIAMALAAQRVRIEAPIPGKSAIGIEVPNKEIAVVKLSHILASPEFKNSASPLAVALGKVLSGEVLVMDITKMPHVLIAGETGSGKSVCLHTIIMSILYHSAPEDVRIILIDPKMVEFPEYNDIPHLLIPVVTDAKLAASSLAWAVREMTSRYEAFAENKVRDITVYNEKMENEGKEKFPRIVLIIDELNDLMMVSAQQVENSICRLAQLARAAGIHLVLATQRPSVNVITGLIKANIPSRISFSVSSQTDSRTILDMGGAEKLLGKGDMLYYPSGESKPMRAQCAYVSDKEIAKVVGFIKKDQTAEYDSKVSESIENTTAGGEHASSAFDDELLPKAMKIAFEKGEISTSMVQRKLKLGYSRAGRIIDEMEEKGYISERQGSNPRRVLVSYDEFFSFENKEK